MRRNALLTAVAALMVAASAQAGIISSFRCADSTATLYDTNITVSSLSGSGWNYSNRFNQTEAKLSESPSGNPCATFDGNSATKTLVFTVTPTEGYKLVLDTLTFFGGDAAFSNRAIALSYQVQGESAVSVGAVTLVNMSAPGGKGKGYSYSISAVSDITVPVTFTLSHTTTDRVIFKVDDIAVNGTVSAVPEPATLSLLGLGGIAAVIRRRRA